MKIQVCTGNSCKERFSEYIIARLERDKEAFDLSNLIVEPCLCTGNCRMGPNVLVDSKLEHYCTPIKISKIALQSKLRLKKPKSEEIQKSFHSQESSPEETLYFKDHITLVKKTPDDSTDI